MQNWGPLISLYVIIIGDSNWHKFMSYKKQSVILIYWINVPFAIIQREKASPAAYEFTNLNHYCKLYPTCNFF